MTADLERFNVARAPTYIDGCVVRTARKEWTCEGDGSSFHRHDPNCPKVIHPGERYVEYLGAAPGYQSGSRHSMECAEEFFEEPER